MERSGEPGRPPFRVRRARGRVLSGERETEGEMGAPQGIEALQRRASFLRESLQKSQTNTDAMVSILGSFDHRLSALEAAMRPTQVFPRPSIGIMLPPELFALLTRSITA